MKTIKKFHELATGVLYVPTSKFVASKEADEYGPLSAEITFDIPFIVLEKFDSYYKILVKNEKYFMPRVYTNLYNCSYSTKT